MKADSAIAEDHRHEAQSHAILLIVNCDGGCSTARAAALGDRVGELAAGQKAGLAAAQDSQVRLGQCPHQIVFGQGGNEQVDRRRARDEPTKCCNVAARAAPTERVGI